MKWNHPTKNMIAKNLEVRTDGIGVHYFSAFQVCLLGTHSEGRVARSQRAALHRPLTSQQTRAVPASTRGAKANDDSLSKIEKVSWNWKPQWHFCCAWGSPWLLLTWAKNYRSDITTDCLRMFRKMCVFMTVCRSLGRRFYCCFVVSHTNIFFG